MSNTQGKRTPAYSKYSYFFMTNSEAFSQYRREVSASEEADLLKSQSLVDWPKLCSRHAELASEAYDYEPAFANMMRDTALFPMCKGCLILHSDRLEVNLLDMREGTAVEIDLCTCRTDLLEAKCWCCQLERYHETIELAVERREYWVEEDDSRHLTCACGKPARETDPLPRKCRVCSGIVTRPFLNLVGQTMLFNGHDLDHVVFKTPDWNAPPNQPRDIEEGPLGERVDAQEHDINGSNLRDLPSDAIDDFDLDRHLLDEANRYASFISSAQSTRRDTASEDLGLKFLRFSADVRRVGSYYSLPARRAMSAPAVMIEFPFVDESVFIVDP